MEPTIGTDMISSDDDRVVGFWSSYDQFFPFNGDAYKSDRPKEDIQSCCEATSLEKVQVESYHHEDLYDMLHANQDVIAHEDEVYFTHTDHLGSASWITNMYGEPIQYMHYAPYGELMANQQAQGYTYDERFKFTGKERDGESGYDYYGARYYTHLLGIWLSVDPLSDKYPHVTPYIFCGGNPVMLVDPDGRQITIYGEDGASYVYKPGEAYEGADKFIGNAVSMLNEMRETDATFLGSAIDEIANATKETYDLQIKQQGNGPIDTQSSSHTPQWKIDSYGKDYCLQSIINIPYMESTTCPEVEISGEKEPLVAVFAHELGHAYDAFHGYRFRYNHMRAGTEDGRDRWIGNKHETMSILFENIMRTKYHINGRKEYYGTSTYKP